MSSAPRSLAVHDLRARGSLAGLASLAAGVLFALGCGGASSGAAPAPPASAAPAPAPQSEFARRQQAACDAAGQRVTGCAIHDLEATSTPAELAKLDLAKMRAVNSARYADKCKADTLSSRQLRVYEVCLQQERACEPLFTCLDNLKPQPAR